MNWDAVTFDWNQVRAFLATVEEGSLSAAARALGLTQPTLGRQVTALEEQLGLTLFERVGRSLVLTEAGLGLIEHVREMGEAATRLSLAASGQSRSVEGTVRITASEVYSGYLLPPIVKRLRESHPGIRAELVVSNSLADLRRREADIAVRNARPTDPDLIARLIRTDHGTLYAAPSLLERLGPITSPADLARADFIGFGFNEPLIEMLNGIGCGVSERNFTVTTENHLVHWALAREGVGIGIVPVSVGDADPGMRRVLPEMPPIPFPIWLVAPRELRTNPRVRIVFDLLAEMLSDAPGAGGSNALDGAGRGS